MLALPIKRSADHLLWVFLLCVVGDWLGSPVTTLKARHFELLYVVSVQTTRMRRMAAYFGCYIGCALAACTRDLKALLQSVRERDCDGTEQRKLYRSSLGIGSRSKSE